MLKKIFSWLFSRTPKIEPYTPAEMAAKRIERLAEALRDLPPQPRFGVVIEMQDNETLEQALRRVERTHLSHKRIATYNHPAIERNRDES